MSRIDGYGKELRGETWWLASVTSGCTAPFLCFCMLLLVGSGAEELYIRKLGIARSREAMEIYFPTPWSEGEPGKKFVWHIKCVSLC